MQCVWVTRIEKERRGREGGGRSEKEQMRGRVKRC